MKQAITAVITYEATINEPSIENMLWIIREFGNVLSEHVRIIAVDTISLYRISAIDMIQTDATISTIVDSAGCAIWRRLTNRYGDNDRPLYDVTVYVNLGDVDVPVA